MKYTVSVKLAVLQIYFAVVSNPWSNLKRDLRVSSGGANPTAARPFDQYRRHPACLPDSYGHW
jgi:hypothetical protein